MANTQMDSNTNWMGSIPKHWDIKKFNALYYLRNEKVSDRDYKPLSVSMKGVVPQLESTAKSDDHDNRKLVRKGDFAINSRSDRRNACGIADRDGSVSLINIVLQPRNTMNPGYYNWLFHTVQFADEYYKWGHGIVDDLWTTGWGDMKNILLPYPPLEEQQLISAFLDNKCAYIDSAINAGEKEIEKLKEYKKSLIAKTVTEGLNPNVEFTESNVGLLGRIPSHWKLNRFKYLFAFGKGLSITKADLVEQGISVISYGQIHAKYNSGVRVDQNLIRFIPEGFVKNSNARVRTGDFIFADTSEDLDGIGNCVYIDTDEPIYAGYHSIIARSITPRDNRFFAYLFKTDGWRFQMRTRVSGVKVYSLPQSILGDAAIVVPPEDEQCKIADYLDERCGKIDRLLSIRQSQVDKLKLYRQSLIYAYVTGKKEVLNG